MKKLKMITLMLLSVAALYSCVEDDAEDFGSGPYVVGFKNAQGSYIYTNLDVNPVQISEPINLIGGSNGTTSPVDITIPFSVDASSTAVAGTDYTLNTTGNMITLQAGSDFVQLPLTVNPAALPGNTPKTIVINLGQPNANTVVSDAKRTITITIAKCESDLAGLYSLQVTRLDNNAIYNFPNEMITALPAQGIGVYETSTTGPYDDLTLDGAPRNGFIFRDVCQTVQIDEQNLGDFYSNLVYGNPEMTNEVNLDPVTGDVVSITMNYTITFAAGNRKFTAVYTKL